MEYCEVFMDRVYGDDESEPITVESTKKSTRATPILSVAVALRVIVPDWVELFAGAVSDTVGAVASVILTVTRLLVVKLFAAS